MVVTNALVTILLNVQVSRGRKAVVCDHQLPLRDCGQGDVIHGWGELERSV